MLRTDFLHQTDRPTDQPIGMKQCVHNPYTRNKREKWKCFCCLRKRHIQYVDMRRMSVERKMKESAYIFQPQHNVIHFLTTSRAVIELNIQFISQRWHVQPTCHIFFSVSLSLPKMSICRRYCAPMSIMFAWWFCAAFFPIKSGWSFLLFSALLYFPFHHWSDFLIFIWPEFYLFPRRSCLLFFPSFPRFSFPLKAMVLFMSIHHTIPYEFMKS